MFPSVLQQFLQRRHFTTDEKEYFLKLVIMKLNEGSKYVQSENYIYHSEFVVFILLTNFSSSFSIFP